MTHLTQTHKNWVILSQFFESLFNLMSSRNWCFTYNNPKPLNIENSYIKLLIATLECGDSKTIHYQGYIEFTSARKLQYCQSLIPGAHFEIRKGKRKDAIAYCLKTLQTHGISSISDVILHDDIYDFGTISQLNNSGLPIVFTNLSDEDFFALTSTLEKKKTVSDKLQEIQTAMKNGKTEVDIAEEHFDLWVKYNNAFRRYQLLLSQPRNFKTYVIVIWGPTGTGKSKWCTDQYPNAYWKPRSQWWDGYTGQDTVVLDEFYGWIPFDTLLRLCDRYPLNVEVKGGTVNFNAKTIILTSNKIPSCWYSNVYFNSFIRRVEEWRIYKSEQEQYTYTDYVESRYNF